MGESYYPSGISMAPEEMDLVVQENDRPSSGRPVCFIPEGLLLKLGFSSGDYIKIEGRKQTGAVVLPLKQGIRGRIIRLDGLLCTNAGTYVGEKVKVCRIAPMMAESITLAPVEGNLLFTPDRKTKPSLVNSALNAGDFVIVHGHREHVTEPPKFIDPALLAEWKRIFPSLDFEPKNISHGATQFFVTATKPSGIVLVGERTFLEFLDKTSKLTGTEVFPDVFDETYEKLSHETDDMVNALKVLPREQVIAQIRAQDPKNSPIQRRVYRSEYVKDLKVVTLALQLANGICQLCEKPGPFEVAAGERYLDIHRLIPFSEDPLDTPSIFAAVCPNCHRELHVGVNRTALHQQLFSKTREIARNLNLL